MLCIYSKETTSFSSLGLGVLKDFIEKPLITEELKGNYILEFKYSRDGQAAEYLVEQNIIKANNQPFRIWQIKKDIESIQVYAKHIVFDLTFNYLEDVAPTLKNAQEALSWMLDRAKTPTNFTANGNCTRVSSSRYVNKNFIDAVFNDDNSLLSRFGGEPEYNVYSIFLHEKRGQNANFSIRYKKNLTGIEFNLDFSTVVTRIYPFGYDGITINEDYIDSPFINSYFTPIYKKIEFSNIKYNPDDNDSYSTLEEAQEALKEEVAKLYANGIDKPTISIKVDFVELSKCEEYKEYSNLESCHLGDTINAILPELGINQEVRIVKTVFDVLNEKFIELELGSITPNLATSQANISEKVDRTISNYLDIAQENAKSLINHPFNGNIYIDKESGVLYLIDTNDINTAQNVWKWSLGGLGFSSTGVNGTYTAAILQDGSINADLINSGKINTDLIEGYSSLLIKVNELDEKDVTEVTTTTGYTFNSDGLNIEKSDAPTKSKLDEAGLEIDYISSGTDKMEFYSGYVDSEVTQKENALADYVGKTVTYTKDIIVKEYIAMPNGRFENVEDTTHGKGIGLFI